MCISRSPTRSPLSVLPCLKLPSWSCSQSVSVRVSCRKPTYRGPRSEKAAAVVPRRMVRALRRRQDYVLDTALNFLLTPQQNTGCSRTRWVLSRLNRYSGNWCVKCGVASYLLADVSARPRARRNPHSFRCILRTCRGKGIPLRRTLTF